MSLKLNCNWYINVFDIVWMGTEMDPPPAHEYLPHYLRAPPLAKTSAWKYRHACRSEQLNKSNKCYSIRYKISMKDLV
jgi:hypothetical protein